MQENTNENGLSELQNSFKNDVLYRMLQRAGLEQIIVSDEMIQKLKVGLNYRPLDAAEITGVNEGTLRGWLNGKDSSDLPVYINAYKENKFHILDAEAVFRVRLIFLVQKELKYSLNHIAGIAVGKGISGKVINQTESQIYIEELKEANSRLENQNKMLFSMISSLFEQNPNGDWKLKNKTPLLEDNQTFRDMKDKIDQLNTQIEDLENELVKEKNNKMDTKVEIIKINMLYRKAESLAMERRNIFEKIFKKRPDIEIVNKYFQELKESD